MADLFSEYDDLVRQSNDVPSGQLKTSLYTTADMNPDQEAGFVKLSQKTGIPVEGLRNDNGAEARRRAAALQVDDDLAIKSPATATFLINPENAKLAHDDIQALAKVESLFSKYIQYGSDIRKTAGTYGALAQQAAEKAPHLAIKGINELLYNVTALTGGQALARAFGDDNPGRLFTDNMAAADNVIKGIEQVKPTTEAQRLGQMAMDSVAANMLTLPLGIAGKVPMLFGFAATAGGQLEDYLDAGYTPVQSAYFSLSNKAMEGLTEMIGVDKLFKGGIPFAKRAIGFLGGDLLGEEVNNAYSQLMAKGTLQPDLSLEEFKKSVVDTAIVTALAGGGQLAMTQPVVALSNEFQRAALARQNQQIMQALGEASTESKLQTRLAEKFREFVELAKQDGDIDNAYIPAEEWRTYWQEKNVDPAQMADQVLDDGGNGYMEALATGGDIVIPIEAYAERLAATEHHTDLSRHIRLRQGDMTLAEADAFDAEKEQRVQELIEQLQAEAQTATAERPSWMKVYDDLYGQLQGVFERSTAERYASLGAIRARTRAERLGVDAFDLYNEAPLKIGRPLPEALRRKTVDMGIDPLLDKLRAGKTPQPSELFGQSLFEFLRAKGIQDQGGELTKMDIGSKPFQKSLVRADGMTLDMAREAAAEAGYLPMDSSVADFLQLIDKEARGEAVYSMQNGNSGLQDEALTLQEMQKALDERDIDLAQMDNEAVRRSLFQGVGGDLWQSAYHGSPHTFDKFSMSAIGTGEGAQAFGYGLYFSGVKEVAEYYRNKLSGLEYEYKGEKLGILNDSDREHELVKAAKDIMGDSYHLLPTVNGAISLAGNATAAEIRNMIADPSSEYGKKEAQVAQKFQKMGVGKVQQGKLYHVELAPTDNELLDWDKPLSEQTEQIKSAVAKQVPEHRIDNLGYLRLNGMMIEGDGKTELTGRDIYMLFKMKEGGGKNGEMQASNFLHSIGVRGIKYKADTIAQQGKKQSYNYVIFSEDDVEIKEYWQKTADAKRGFFRASPLNTSREIGILENADLSTFIHELSHSWLEELKQDAERPDAPQQLKDDYAAIKAWAGIDGDISVEAHELFARAGEAYVMEGKAPSAELQGVFQRFKAWLTRIYRELSGLNVKLNDDVRAVFDRLLATDEEISQAEKAQGYAPLFATAEDAGMSKAEFAAYQKDASRASEEARATLEQKLLAELSREQKAWWKERLAEMRAQVEEEAKQAPVYQAFQLLTKGETFDGTKPEGDLTWKLSKAELVKLYGEPFLKNLPRGFGYIYTADGGVSPDFMAEMFGFASGDEMIRRMIEAPKMKEWIKAESDIRMKELYGDMLNDGSLVDQATAAVHGDRRGDVLRAELKAIRKKQGEVAPFVRAMQQEQTGQRKEMQATIPPVSYFRALAAQTIGEKLVKDIDPRLYLNAERKAGRLAFEAAAKGDFTKAGEQKQKQLLNHYLYLEAVTAREEADTIRDYMAKLGKRDKLGKIAMASPEFLAQIDGILERYEFIKVPLRELQARQNLGEWLDGLSEAYGLDVPVDSSVLNMQQINYRDIPMDELRSVYDSVRAIVHAANLMNSIRSDLEVMTLEDAEERLVGQAREAIPETQPMYLTNSSMSFMEKVGDTAGIADQSLLRTETITEWLDGGTTGPWHDLLWNRAVEADNKRNELRGSILPKLQEIMDGMGKDRKARLMEKREIVALGESLTYYEMIGIALNTGNESNLTKMMNGGLWFGEEKKYLHEGALAEVLGNLDAQDWQMVQGLWDAVETLWPEIAHIEKLRSGLDPVKVLATPIETVHGTFSGGYWPVVYDSRHSRQGEKQADSNQRADQLLGQSFTKAATRKGHIKERVENFSRPLQLDWRSVVSRHVDNVITDVSHWEFVFQVRRLLARDGVKKAVQTRVGETAFRSLEGWLKYTVNADYFGDPAAAGWQRARQIMTSNLAIAALGFKLMTAVGNIVVAPVQASARMNPKEIARGVGEFLRNPKAAMAMVQALSGQMKNRQLEVDKTLQETLNTLAGNDSMRAQIGRAAMSMHLWADRIASTGLWLGAYRGRLNKGDTELEAIRAADKVIRMTQTAGAPKDLSAFERDPQYAELKMFLGPMLIMGNGIRSTFGSKGGVKMWTPEAWGKLFALWFGPAIIFELAVGRGPDDDDENGWAKWGLTKLLLYPLQTIPIIRDVAGMIEGVFLGNRPITTRGLPIMEAGAALVKAANQTYKAITDDGDTEKAVKADIKAAGLLFGLPTGQLSITGEFLYDVLSGNYEPENPWSPARDLLMKRKESR